MDLLLPGSQSPNPMPVSHFRGPPFRCSSVFQFLVSGHPRSQNFAMQTQHICCATWQCGKPAVTWPLSRGIISNFQGLSVHSWSAGISTASDSNSFQATHLHGLGESGDSRVGRTTSQPNSWRRGAHSKLDEPRNENPAILFAPYKHSSFCDTSQSSRRPRPSQPPVPPANTGDGSETHEKTRHPDHPAVAFETAGLELVQEKSSQLGGHPCRKEVDPNPREKECEEAFTGSTYLKELRIRDFALIKESSTSFGPGLNVITGESGAGKSIILGALSQVLGAPLIEDCIRHPASSAVVQGRFHVGPTMSTTLKNLLSAQAPAAAGCVVEGQEVVLSREILRESPAPETPPNTPTRTSGQTGAGGKALRCRSICSVNGTVVPLKVLRALGSALVDVNGQNSQGLLRSESSQGRLLDRMAGSVEECGQFGELAREALTLSKEAEVLGEGGQEEEEALQELVEDVETLGLVSGEAGELEEELREQEESQAAVELCRRAHGGIHGGGSRGDGRGGGLGGGALTVKLRGVMQDLEEVVDRGGGGEEGEGDGSYDSVIHALALLEEAEAAVNKAGECLETFASELEFSELRIAEVRQRLKQIELIRRKHGAPSADGLVEMADDAAARLGNSEDIEARIERVRVELERRGDLMAALAVAMSGQRREAAAVLKGAVETALHSLGMPHSRFECRLDWEKCVDEEEEEEEEEEEGWEARSEGGRLRVSERLLQCRQAGDVGEDPLAMYRYSDTGLDSVAWNLGANLGEAMLPLAQVASGGECSRIMLALKAVPGAAEGAVPVAVFDEVDTGVGGRIGAQVGTTLRQLATAQQVVCVTHLPQVAVCASRHVQVVKRLGSDGRMQSQTIALTSREERAEEVASMLGLGVGAALELFSSVEGGGRGWQGGGEVRGWPEERSEGPGEPRQLDMATY